MLLITDLPRDTGVGQYVHDLAITNRDAVIFYRGEMPLEKFEMTSRRNMSNSIISEGYYYTQLKILSNKLSPISHIVWEGFGPVLGPNTKLITIHHVLPPDGGFLNQTRSLGAALLKHYAVRGHIKVVKWEIPATVPSNDTKQQLIKYYSARPGKIEVIPHAIDTEFFRQMSRGKARAMLSLPDSKFIIFTVADDDLRKNIEVVFKAFRKLKERFSDILWVHLGKSAYLSQVHNKEKNILFMNDLPKEMVRTLYSACDVLVLPSRGEGFSRTLLEALSCNLRVITSDLELFKEQMGEYYDGVTPTVDNIVMKLAKIYKGEDFFDFNGVRTRIIKQFGLEEFARRYQRLYEKVGLIE